MEREKVLVGFVEDGSYSIRESSSLEALLKELDKARKVNKILIGGPFFANNRYTAIIGLRKIVRYDSNVKEKDDELNKDFSTITQTNIVDGDGKLKHVSFDCFGAPTIDAPVINYASDKSPELLADILNKNKSKTTLNKYCLRYNDVSNASKLFYEEDKEALFLLNMTYFCQESNFSILYKISKLIRTRQTDGWYFEFSECDVSATPSGNITFDYEEIDNLTKLGIGKDILKYFPIDFFGKFEDLTNMHDIDIIDDFKSELRYFLKEHKDDIKNKITADASLSNAYKNIIFNMHYVGDSGAIPMDETDIYLFNIHELNTDGTINGTNKSKIYLNKVTEEIFSKQFENKLIESRLYDYRTSDIIEGISNDFMNWKPEIQL